MAVCICVCVEGGYTGIAGKGVHAKIPSKQREQKCAKTRKLEILEILEES